MDFGLEGRGWGAAQTSAQLKVSGLEICLGGKEKLSSSYNSFYAMV